MDEFFANVWLPAPTGNDVETPGNLLPRKVLVELERAKAGDSSSATARWTWFPDGIEGVEQGQTFQRGGGAAEAKH